MPRVNRSKMIDSTAPGRGQSSRQEEDPGRSGVTNVPNPAKSRVQERRLEHNGSRNRCRKLAVNIKSQYQDLKCVINSTSSANATRSDSEELEHIRKYLQLKPNQVQLYWTHGSVKNGFLGAGVAAHGLRDGRPHYSTSYHRLGFDTGQIQDAELFAIAAALGCAKRSVEANKQIQLVRVYSDAMGLLESLQDDECFTLGPLIAGKTALEALYQRAAWLDAKEVIVELIWVKGHSDSKGNRIADACAGHAVAAQMSAELNSQGFPVQEGRKRLLSPADVPVVIKQLGRDWSDEWLWRANRDVKPDPPRNEAQHGSGRRATSGDVESKNGEHFGTGASPNVIYAQPSRARWGLGFTGETSSPGAAAQAEEARLARTERDEYFDAMAKRYAELDDARRDHG